MFSSAVQPPLVSLFSSTGSDPLTLFSSHTDKSLPADSCICLLNDSTSLPHPPPPATLVSLDDGQDPDRPDYELNQTVLHMQSPVLRTTYVRCPPLGQRERGRGRRVREGDLGLEHPWIHLQVRNLHREWSFEVGIVDQSGREGIVRCSTFQREPRLQLTKSPLLHLPLSFPSPVSRPLTSWSTITLNLPSLLPHFSSASLIRVRETSGNAEDDVDEQDSDVSHVFDGPRRAAVPSGTYSHVSYVKVYATCRLRRIWLTENDPRQKLPWEFELYAA
ncbi:uncharacterized protein C8Q71DRAFT_774485 [Rhodofomes roseus]|uniref:CFA20 domain-containing protein n=1 Tax=Rhodofomes roseus TaxID=34475 RepID=A0ABQ8K804_9APHY|nr:uncharacterized protein C8Q71DRAFT_774485 [Rhodofomes roseus]KAH9833179.1 hypothetical protein C8Q71DRAFT_774485 [Rhodofomes roseus]